MKHRTVLSYFVRFLVLTMIVSFERVVGLPLLFAGATLAWLEVAEKSGKIAIIVVAGFILSLVYVFPFTLGWIILLGALGLVLYAEKIIPSPTSRLLITTTILAGSVGLVSSVVFSLRVLFYAVVSLLILTVMFKGIRRRSKNNKRWVGF